MFWFNSFSFFFPNYEFLWKYNNCSIYLGFVSRQRVSFHTGRPIIIRMSDPRHIYTCIIYTINYIRQVQTINIFHCTQLPNDKQIPAARRIDFKTIYYYCWPIRDIDNPTTVCGKSASIQQMIKQQIFKNKIQDTY